MLKLTIAVVAIALAGTASAENWKDLRVDGSSEDAFAQSLAEFKEKLSPARAYVFGGALKDIWIQGVKAAEAEQREYTASDYYAQVDGLRYEQVVTLADPTGATAKSRMLEGRSYARVAPANTRGSPWPVSQTRPHVRGLDAAGLAQQQHHGGQGMNPSGTY
jgi:hypothetical protein